MSAKEYIAIFDTNKIRSLSFVGLFGSQGELTDFAQHCRIVIPELVIEELMQQKKEEFSLQRKQLEQNTLFKGLHEDVRKNASEEVQEVYNKLQTKRLLVDVAFEVIPLSDKEKALDQVTSLAVARKEPFFNNKEKIEFKDALILQTILQYVSHCQQTVYVVARDTDLIEELRKEGVNVVKDFNEFYKRISVQSTV